MGLERFGLALSRALRKQSCSPALGTLSVIDSPGPVWPS